MAATYAEYKSRIISPADYPAAIEDARREYGIAANAPIPPIGSDIPFNLEQEYFEVLLMQGRVKEAWRVVERMRLSYPILTAQHLIRAYEARLETMQGVEARVQEALSEAKRDLRAEHDSRTTLLVALVAGVIAIFGAATSVFRASTFDEAWMTFMGISFAVIVLVFVGYACSYLFRRR